MNQHQLKLIKGCLEVKAIQDTQMGVSDQFVPKGTIGYVLGHQHGTKQWLIFWPPVKPRYKGDWRSGSHDSTTVQPTGKRG